MSNLVDLLNSGQSYWLDNLTRKKITSGELKKRVSEQGLRGITSNPSIFFKAISGSEDYDDQIKELVAKGCTVREIYDALTIKDVQDACDILKPVYDSSDGTDGFVSLEVSPYLALDSQGSIEEARRLYASVNRLNCYIKIPSTIQGIPAIETLLYEGININVTLLFSIERYVDVANAYIRAIKRRLGEGKPVQNIVSVASFFLSRIDVLADQLLSQHISGNNNKEIVPQTLMGKIGIASAQLAYQRFKELFIGADWQAMASKGAHVQRPLWASTSNKDPLHSDVRYVEALIGKDTVNTLPDETIEAFEDHGKIQKDAIESDIAGATQTFEELKKIGIDIDLITWQLEQEGINKFVESFSELMTALAEKREKILGSQFSTQDISYGPFKKEIESAYASMDEKQVGARLYGKDPSLWKTEPEEAKMITESMGWLTLPDNYAPVAADILTFAKSIKEEGYKHAVLLGMGGSSLCSEVARATYGTTGGYLELLVLDNTSPAAILDIEKQVDIEKTLFIAATKSGNTAETLSFFKYFYQELQKKGNANTGNNFVAITDAGSPLVKMAADYKFRKVFINPSDIGGRYSVLSDFGLLPMALMGIDINAIMAGAKQTKTSSDASVPVAVNPGISLGVVLGICQRQGRDKVTFVLSSSISSFGFWVEQLLAESTGKEGKGLIPVNGEQLGDPDVYGKDRIFIQMYLPSDDTIADEQKLKALEAAGHPVVRIRVTDKMALGGEYYRWEIAVATAGVVIGINPFNQPNVAESKKNTNDLLAEWNKDGSFKKADPILKNDGLSIYSSAQVAMLADKNTTATAFINAFGALAQPGDYIAFLPYFLMTDDRTKILQEWRMRMRNELKTATTLLNGPRYLHSTGQLHKGGPATGLYIILVSDESNDLPIPGEKYGFATLHEAQSLGDFRSLNDKGRRVIRINLGKDIDKGLETIWTSLRESNTLQHA
ncbi:MAG: bifunctional transaldolase/phosoglucose isomerase [Taibaiella sp.]|nr:bifunctional transaldolase/phosoglucose isomerase [Taibaiella sp.]